MQISVRRANSAKIPRGLSPASETSEVDRDVMRRFICAARRMLRRIAAR